MLLRCGGKSRLYLPGPAGRSEYIMSKRIVVIEDDEIILEFIELLLQQKDFTVVIASNGKDGLAMVRQHKPDLIMSDLHMAGGDGLFVLRSVREDPGTAHIPFVLVTADLDPEAQQRCYAMGATRVFLKPFDPDLLVEAIENLLVARVRHAVEERTMPVARAVEARNATVEPDMAETRARQQMQRPLAS